jgi:hypothetical protein
MSSVFKEELMVTEQVEGEGELAVRCGGVVSLLVLTIGCIIKDFRWNVKGL